MSLHFAEIHLFYLIRGIFCHLGSPVSFSTEFPVHKHCRTRLDAVFYGFGSTLPAHAPNMERYAPVGDVRYMRVNYNHEISF